MSRFNKSLTATLLTIVAGVGASLNVSAGTSRRAV